jgi:hypothetical protein
MLEMLGRILKVTGYAYWLYLLSFRNYLAAYSEMDLVAISSAAF